MIKNLGLMMIALLMFSFATAQNTTKDVKIDDSKVVWKAYKVTGSHEGTINLTSASLDFSKEKLIGGTFLIDMTSINVTDLSGDYKKQLEGHLKSDDFFGVQNFSTAKLVLTKVKATGKNSYRAKADLSIKNITKSVTFDLSIYGNKATASLKVDRTDFDVRYGSSSFFDDLKDKAIYDEFDLVVDLVF